MKNPLTFEKKLSLRALQSPISFTRREIPSTSLVLYWLGQAGFLLETEQLRIVVDAYLSDTLARKYAQKELPHIRMMPPPVPPAELRDIQYVFSSHAHTDHMDPGTIMPIAAANPDCRFIVPASETDVALQRGVPLNRMIAMDAGDSYALAPGVSVEALASAHEEREKDSLGRDRYLGYFFDFHGLTVYHSGDCVPYEGLRERLVDLAPSICLLPVNGRDTYRTSRGISGNFTLREAITLAADIGADFLIGHHFGLFNFNTIDRKEAHTYIDGVPKPTGLDIRLAEAAIEYRFEFL